jgi:hypothetical protein
MRVLLILCDGRCKPFNLRNSIREPVIRPDKGLADFTTSQAFPDPTLSTPQRPDVRKVSMHKDKAPD